MLIAQPSGARRGQAGGKKSHTLNYEKLFSKEKILSVYKSSPADESDSSRKLSILPKGFEHIIDFTQYHSTSVYNWANSNTNKVSDLQNQSFYDSLKVYFERQYEINKLFTVSQSLCDCMTI